MVDDVEVTGFVVTPCLARDDCVVVEGYLPRLEVQKLAVVPKEVSAQDHGMLQVVCDDELLRNA